MYTYLLENMGDFLVVESQVESFCCWWELGVQPQGAGVCENRLRSKRSSGTRRRPVVFQGLCMELFCQFKCKFHGRCSLSLSRALGGALLSQVCL